MSIFGKTKDYTKDVIKESRDITIDITHCIYGKGICFDINSKNEYFVNTLEELSSGKIKSATLIDTDGKKHIFSSLYIKNSIVSIIY